MRSIMLDPHFGGKLDNWPIRLCFLRCCRRRPRGFCSDLHATTATTCILQRRKEIRGSRPLDQLNDVCGLFLGPPTVRSHVLAVRTVLNRTVSSCVWVDLESLSALWTFLTNESIGVEVQVYRFDHVIPLVDTPQSLVELAINPLWATSTHPDPDTSHPCPRTRPCTPDPPSGRPAAPRPRSHTPAPAAALCC